jgi:hypothetical protein
MDEGFALSIQPTPDVPTGKWLQVSPGDDAAREY